MDAVMVADVSNGHVNGNVQSADEEVLGIKAEVNNSQSYADNNNGHSSTPVKAGIAKNEPITPETKPSKRASVSAKKRKYADSEEDEDYDDGKGSDDDDAYVPDKKKSRASTSKSDKSPKKSPAVSAKSKKLEKEKGKKDKKKSKKEKEKEKKSSSSSKKSTSTKSEDTKASPSKKKKQEEEEDVWKWWEEEKKTDGTKWRTLVHRGPLFAAAYEPVPDKVHFRYDGKNLKLSEKAEEVASFYARMLDHDYTTKETFNKNFFKDWRKVMTPQERETITDLKKCDFRALATHFTAESEARKNATKEEKEKLKELRAKEQEQYGVAWIDGHKQKVANFRVEPPGLFRGRGDHPKMGCLKRRVQPEDVIINCSNNDEIPKPPAGHEWKEVRHDKAVSWLCCWTENVLGQNKYIMLNPSSKMKGEKDWEKFEKARSLGKIIDKVRETYWEDMASKEMRVRQRAVAMYFIDKLALRAGNEKDTDEAADTVGCCSLRFEHVKLHPETQDGRKYVVEFDFLGKDSIRYNNDVAVDKRVFKNLTKFMENKSAGDDLFDRIDTTSLNDYLKTIMPGLTAKCFRTYNASFTLQAQLKKLTNANDTIHEKMLSYNRANRQVAILCNHQRSIPKSHEKSMENLNAKIKEKKKELKEAKAERDKAKGKEKERLEKKVQRLKDQLKRLKTNKTDKDENKQIALGTSKLNYLDPRISVAWCRKFNVPIEKVYNKTQREKFRWAIEMIQDDDVYEF